MSLAPTPPMLVLMLTAIPLLAACPSGEPPAAASEPGVKAYVERKTQASAAVPDKASARPSGGEKATEERGAAASAAGQAGAPEVGGEASSVGPTAQRFQLTVVGGEGLPDLDDGPGVTDAYVILEYDGERHQTSVSASLTPSWGDSFAFEFRPGATLRVTLMDQDSFSDEKVGVTTVSVPSIPQRGQKMLDVPFGGGDNGKVLLKLVGL